MFTGKWVFCVFSYNRGDFLQNLLDSVQQYYPEADIAVFDDGSNEAKAVSILKELKAAGQHVYITDKSAPDCKHGGLYHMMNEAIGYAKTNNYDYAYFIQDDMQFLWRDEELEDKVARVFSKEDCLMCNCNFLLKIYKHDTPHKLIKAGEYYSFTGHGVGDTGIIHLAKARKYGLHFPHHAERDNGKYWQDKGFKMYWLPCPHLAWMPWPKVYRFKEVQQSAVHHLELKQGAEERLGKNKSYAFLEDYAETTAKLTKPYWHGASPGRLTLLKVYLKYYLGKRLLQ